MNIQIKKHANFTTALVICFVVMLTLIAFLYAKLGILTNNSIKITRTGVNYAYPTPTPTPTATPTPSPEEIREEIIKLVNNKRANKGLPPLKENSLLDNSAQLKLSDMIEKNYWDHISPEGVTPWTFFQKAGYMYDTAGENLARDFANAQITVIAWMNSPEHKKQILGSSYKDTGVAVTYTHSGTSLMLVQHFGSKRKVYSNDTAPTDSNRTPSRTGRIIPYHDWCNNKDLSVYENEIIVKKSSDGNTYGMTADDWSCYESYLTSKR